MDRLKWVEDTAKQIMEKSGSHSPQFLMVLPDNKIEMYLVHFDSDESKEQMFKTMKKFVQDRQVVEYYFICESWKATIDKEEKAPFVRASQHPNKTECLMISNYRRDMKNTEILIDFKRDGKKIIWGEKMVSAYDLRGDDALQTKSRWNFFVEDVDINEVFKR